MSDARMKGINLLTGIDMSEDRLVGRYQEGEIISIPFSKIHNTAIYNHNEIEIDIPFEDFNEQHDVMCGIRFFIPNKTDIPDAEQNEPSHAEVIHESIRKKSKIEENVGDLLCTLPDLPLVVPRGKYTADLYRDNTQSKGELRLHGSTFSYKVNFKNIVKAFLLPQNDDSNTNLVVGFDKPLRQGNTSYPYIIFQFKRTKETKIELKMPKEQLEITYPELAESYEGFYYEIVAKLFKLIIGINVIIPGEFKTTGGHAGLKCHIGNQEGLLFPLNKSLIFIKKPVIYLRLDQLSHIEFHRTSAGHTIRGFDFTIFMKATGVSTTFSGADRRELDQLKAYFEKNKVEMRTVEDKEVIGEDLGDESEDGDKLNMNDGEEEGEEEDDDDFVDPGEDGEEDDDGDYDAEK